MLRYASGLETRFVHVQIDIMKEAAREFEATLRAFLHFKPKKASDANASFASGVDGDNSILEMAMKFV
jgi:hypothetical protein